ncbi:unnamed protein product [Phaeothamnion confervicola]
MSRRSSRSSSAAASRSVTNEESEPELELESGEEQEKRKKYKGKGKRPAYMAAKSARRAPRVVGNNDNEDDDGEPEGTVGAGASDNDGGGDADSASAEGDADKDEDGAPTFNFTQESQEMWVGLHGTEGIVKGKEKDRASSLSETSLELLIGNMMRFLLMKGARREPITKVQMQKEVIGDDKKHRVFNVVLDEANQRLKRTLGLELKDTLPGKPWSVKDTWYLVNARDIGAGANKESHSSAHFEELADNSEAPQRGLLMVVLALIFCQPDQKLTEDVLFRRLHDLDPNIPGPTIGGGKAKSKGRVTARGAAEVDGLGDVHALLSTFVKQHYLRVDKTETPEGEPLNRYQLGSRTYVEVGRRQISTFIADTLQVRVDATALQQLHEDEREATGNNGGGGANSGANEGDGDD